MENPKGGVKKDVCRFIAIIRPNQSGSIPRKGHIGTRMGTTMKQISMKSRKNPIRKINNILRTKNMTLLDSNEAILSRITTSPPNPLKTREKAVAPIKTKKTIEVSFTV